MVLLFLACAACAFQCSDYVLIHWSPKFGTYVCIYTYEESLSDFQRSSALLVDIHVKLNCKWGSGRRRMVLLSETQAADLWSLVHVCWISTANPCWSSGSAACKFSCLLLLFWSGQGKHTCNALFPLCFLLQGG